MPGLRVLHIIKSLGRGGAETLLAETIRLTDSSRFQIHVIYFLPWKDQMVSAIRQSGAQVTCFSATNNLLILLQAFNLQKYCRQHKIDVIHCHLPWAGFVGRLLFRTLRIPVIYTEHNLQERYHFFTRFLNRVTFNSQSCAIAVSDDVGQSIRKNIKPVVNVVTIPNGVNTAKFVRDLERGEALREELSIPESATVIGTIAVFRFQKRLTEWIELAQSLYSKHPTLYFMIVGAGPLEKQLKEFAATTALKSRLIFPGLQTDVIPWLSAMDIYMMTSKFEGLPIALLEAMSMECAVVTTDAGGIKEVIRNGADGLMCQVDEYRQLEVYIESLIQDRGRIPEFGKAARKRILEQFSLEKMIRRVEQVYLQVTETHSF